MNLENLMNISPDTLAREQRDALINHAVLVLEDIQQALKKRTYDRVEELLFFSPAGDGYGSDNHCINFQYRRTLAKGEQHIPPMDLAEIVERIRRLDEICTKNNG